jgi:hypothetical protein
VAAGGTRRLAQGVADDEEIRRSEGLLHGLLVSGSKKRAGIKTVFGFDRHFEAMGFRIWPAD